MMSQDWKTSQLFDDKLSAAETKGKSTKKVYAVAAPIVGALIGGLGCFFCSFSLLLGCWPDICPDNIIYDILSPIWHVGGVFAPLLIGGILGAISTNILIIVFWQRSVLSRRLLISSSGLALVAVFLLLVYPVLKKPASSQELTMQLKIGKKNFTRANLTKSRITYCDLTDAILTEVNLDGAYLNHVKMVNADLRGASFVGAHFIESNLQGADLRGADFTRAILVGSKLLRSHSPGAYLRNARYNEATVWPQGFDPVEAGAILAD